MEGVGAILNCYPACYACCNVSFGCCICFWLLLSAIGGTVGASVPSFQQETCSLITVIVVSSVTLVLRSIMLIVFAFVIKELEITLQRYNTCYNSHLNKPPSSVAGVSDSTSAQKFCSTKYLAGATPAQIQGLNKALIFACVVVGLYAIVSLVGLIFASLGCGPEQSARAGGAASPGGVAFAVAVPRGDVVLQAEARVVQPSTEVEMTAIATPVNGRSI